VTGAQDGEGHGGGAMRAHAVHADTCDAGTCEYRCTPVPGSKLGCSGFQGPSGGGLRGRSPFGEGSGRGGEKGKKRE
jgi:hypothetical protein